MAASEVSWSVREAAFHPGLGSFHQQEQEEEASREAAPAASGMLPEPRTEAL